MRRNSVFVSTVLRH